MNTHELELLADYAAGVLDGTPTGASVARRIAADPGWADSHAALVAADATVRNALTRLRPVPMPAAVADRLASSLAAERLGGAAAVVPAAVVLPLRRRAWQAGGAVAAGFALLAAGALGWQTLRGTTSGESADTAAAPASSGTAQKTFGSDSATGGDYTRAGLPEQVRQLLAGPATREDLGRTSGKAAPAAPDSLATGVDRLRDPAALAACVRALGLTGPPLATDFGRYEGRPALVLVLSGTTPATLTAVVVGPSCGMTGPDELRRATVTR